MIDTAATPEFGPYSFDYTLTEEHRKNALSVAELTLLRQGGPSFVGEEVIHGIPVMFEDELWETVVGAVDGQIYKISLKTSDDCVEINKSRARLVSTFDGRYRTAVSPSKWMSIWDCTDGNLVLDQHDGEFSSLVLTATSRSVSNFRKITSDRTPESDGHQSQAISAQNSSRLAAICFSSFWVGGFWLATAYKWWAIVRVPIAMIAFLVTLFSIKHLIMSFTNDG